MVYHTMQDRGEEMKESTKISIKKVLRRLHLLYLAKSVYQKISWIYDKATVGQRTRKFESVFDDFYAEVRQTEVQSNGILCMGILCTPHKPTLIPFLSQVKDSSGKQIILLDESREEDAECPFPRFRVPRSAPVKYDRNIEFKGTPEMQKKLEEKEFLGNAVKNITERLPNIKESYAKVLVYKSYEMYHFILDTWKPSEVIIWSEYNALHTVFAHTCREKGIDPIFMEFGVLPGTFALERGGQMGKSDVAVNDKDFLALQVNDAELEKTQDVLQFLKESGLNRNIQPDGNAMKHLEKRLKPNRPIVLFAGQHDFDSGMVPYTEETKKYHSPAFVSSLDAVKYLAELAEKNDWNFIFKPHPGMVNRYRKTEFPENTIYLTDINLNELIDRVDVVVTLMSQTAYVSLIRGCATVTMGYNQLRGKGCNYEAFSKEIIEEKIKEAIVNGYTEDQKEKFLLHTAQLLKYYLFDDMRERKIRYGKSGQALRGTKGF